MSCSTVKVIKTKPIKNYEFNPETNQLTIGKDIENKTITDIVDIPQNEIKSVTIKNNVTSIGESAFKGCWSLKEVDIQNRLTSIDETAFEGCTGLF